MKFRSALATSAALACLTSVALAASGGVQFRGTTTIGDVAQEAERIVMEFAPRTNVLLGGTVVSDVVRYDGPKLSTSVSGGEMRLCTTSACGTPSSWVTSGPIAGGQFVQLRRAGPQAAGATVTAALEIAGQRFAFDATARSQAPAFDAIAVASAGPGEAKDSSLSTFHGWVEAPIAVTGGEYRVCSAQGSCGSFTSAAGTVRDGDQVQLRLVAGAFGESRTASVTAGGASASFAVSVRTKDVTPDAFAPFDAQTSQNAPGFVWVTTPRLLKGHDGIDVSVSGQSAEYRLCTTADCSDKGTSGWTSAVGQAANGQYVQMRLTTGAFGETRSATLVTGTVSSTLAVTTRAKDTTPDAFALGTGPTGVEPGSASTSQTATLAGFDDAPISIAGTGASYSLNGGSFTTTAGTAKSGDTVRVQLTAGAVGETRQATLAVGGTSASWSSTVRARDVVPDTVTFPALTDQAAGATVVSAIRQLVSHDGVTVTATNAMVRVCSTIDCSIAGPFVSSTTVPSNGYVQLQSISPAAGTSTTASLSYGATTPATWSITSKANGAAYTCAEVAASPRSSYTNRINSTFYFGWMNFESRLVPGTSLYVGQYNSQHSALTCQDDANSLTIDNGSSTIRFIHSSVMKCDTFASSCADYASPNIGATTINRFCQELGYTAGRIGGLTTNGYRHMEWTGSAWINTASENTADDTTSITCTK